MFQKYDNYNIIEIKIYYSTVNVINEWVQSMFTTNPLLRYTIDSYFYYIIYILFNLLYKVIIFALK